MIYCSRCLSRGRLIRVSSARLKVGYRTCASCGPKLRIGRKPVGRDVWFCRKRECSSRLSRTRVSAGLCYCRRHGISIKKTSRPKFIDARHTLATPRLLRPRQAIRVAEFCCGWCAGIQALMKLQLPHALVLACDCSTAVQQLVQANFRPAQWRDDMLRIPTSSLPKADIALAGFPCQSYSTDGLRQGLTLESRRLLRSMCRCIAGTHPKIILLENVPGFEQHQEAFQWLLRSLSIATNNKFQWYKQTLDAYDYSLPQTRKRLYIVGLRRRLGAREFHWPAQSKPSTLASILRRRSERICSAARRQPRAGSNAHRHLRKGLLKLRALGNNPKRVPCVVDMRDTRSTNVAVRRFPTITASKAAGLDFYLPHLNRRATVRELSRAQGMCGSISDTCLSRSAFGTIVGNAMPVNVVAAVLRQALVSIGC